MRHEIILAPGAVNDVKCLKAYLRPAVRDAIEEHLRYHPTKVSRSRIKRLQGLTKPQFRLRSGELRVFYDVRGSTVEILAIVPKSGAVEWLKREGVMS